MFWFADFGTRWPLKVAYVFYHLKVYRKTLLTWDPCKLGYHKRKMYRYVIRQVESYT